MQFNHLVCLSLSTALVLAAAQDADSSASGDLMQQLALLPTCALDCIGTAMPLSPCPLGDLSCLCADASFSAQSGACVLANCTIKEALTTQKWQTTACDIPTENHAGLTRRVCWVLFGLATLAIFLRFLLRATFLEGNLGWDDWMILFSYLGLIPCTAFVQKMTNDGLGQNIWMVPFDGVTSVLYDFYVEEFLYCFIVVTTKISIILLYMRIVPASVSPRFRIACWAVMSLMTAYMIAFLIALATQCTPVSYTWTQWTGETHGSCVDLEAEVYAGAITNIIWDIVVFVMPIPRLIKLQVRDTRKKVMVILTFLVGLFGTVCSIIRLRYLTQWGKSANATMHYNDIAIWSAVEADVGVICACMPAIAGPVLQWFKRVVGTRLSRNKSKFSTGGSSKGVQRVPSSTEHSDTVYSVPKFGGISKTVEATMYNMPYEVNSDDDVELMGQARQSYKPPGAGSGQQQGKGPLDYSHEYAGPWR